METMVINEAPEQSYRWLRPFLPKKMQPLLRGVRKRLQRRQLNLAEPYYSVFPFTQASPARQQNLVRLAGIIEAQNIPGVLAECGVLDGGTSALMALATAHSGREVHLFDAWQGLPLTTPEDGAGGVKWAGQVVGSPKRVVKCMETMKVSPERLHFHVGWFHETFPVAEVPQVALLHIDCDFYEPTKLCLDRWYPSLSPGGFIQFDDYDSFVGCHTAVNEFLKVHPELRIETFGEVGQAYYLQKPCAEKY